jgi:L-aminopeptidase/D-esterase-like protein
MSAGVDIRGGGPASRETPLLDPLMSARAINAIVFAGGSAFGLEASNGVMEYLEEKDIGYDVGVTKVPLTVQSDIFDLKLGDKMSRPDHAMGYEAARCAFEEDNYRDGNYGAGCGATIALRNVMKAVKPEDHAVICNATSCMEVAFSNTSFMALRRCVCIPLRL